MVEIRNVGENGHPDAPQRASVWKSERPGSERAESEAEGQGWGRSPNSDSRQKRQPPSTSDSISRQKRQPPSASEAAFRQKRQPPLPAQLFSPGRKRALYRRQLGLSAQPHPMRLIRRELRRSSVRAIAELADVEAGRVTQGAGWAISAQRPPTAKGMGFLVLEDETGRLPVALPPRLAAQMHRILRDARVVAVCGRVERVRWYHSLLALDLRAVG